MSIQDFQTRRFQEFASSIGSRELADLARALPWLESGELARILTAMPADERSVR